MILPPRRSVTRFFIPLIDVLILLFAIFLLMPFVGKPASRNADTRAEPKETLPSDVVILQRDLVEARAELARMKERMQAGIADRLSVRVLQVGKDRNGVYLYYYSPERQEIRTGTDALKLITQQKDIANKAGGVKEILFLILYPRDASGFPANFPNLTEEKMIRGWFEAERVPLKFD